MIRGIPSNRCPADSFIKYFRECIAKQEEFKKQGKEVPEEYKTPDKVYLTENCIKFFNEYSGADFLVAPKKGSENDEIIFYWEEANNIPALELVMSIDENDNWIIKYINEKAIGDQPAIEWKYDPKKVSKSIRTIYMNTNEINESRDIVDYLETSCDDFER